MTATVVEGPSRDELAAAGGLTMREASKFSSLGKTLLYQLMDAGRLHYSKVNGRRVILKASLVKLMSDNVVGSTR